MKQKSLRVLVVDDDESARKDLTRLLGGVLGHVVVATAGDGGEALGFFEQNRNAVDLVITDYNIPRMNGAQLAHGIRAFGSPVPVIVMTGGDPDSVRTGERDVVVLEKPIGRGRLEYVIAELCGDV